MEGIKPHSYYSWTKEFMEAGREKLTRESVRDATRHEIQALRRENDEPKQLVAVVGCQLLSLDCSGLALHAKPQTFGGISLHLSGRFIFGFDHYRGATGGGNQNVCVAARIVGEGLGVLGADFTARHHPPQQLAQGVVGVWLRLARHTTSLSDSKSRSF